MKILSITEDEIGEFLEGASFGRIACEYEGQPYIADAYFTVERGFLYGFSAIGQKIRWMRANPRVCVQFEEIRSPQDWTTVVVLGVYEELTKAPEHEKLRNRAYTLLQKRAMWWEPATVKVGNTEEVVETIYFRIRMDRRTGRRGFLEGGGTARESWIRRVLHASDRRNHAP